MKKEMKRNEYIGFFMIGLIALVGTLVYLYVDINNVFINLVLPINNSLWDFGKLMFFSILLFSIIQYFIIGKYFPNFIFAKTACLFLAPILFILGSYFIDLLIGTPYITTHIIIFIIAIFIGQYISYYFIENELHFKLMNTYAVLTIIIMIGIFLAYLNQTENLRSPIFQPM